MSGFPELLAATRLVPVVVIEDLAAAEPVAAALLAGGLTSAEVTMRTPQALSALQVMAERGLFVGAGTVLRPDQVEQAAQAGARFVVSPGFSLKVLKECRYLGMPYLPGVVTSTEIMRALDEGIDLLKFFPAEVIGGVAAIRALAGPFANVRFVPTGGIGGNNVRDYLCHSQVLAVGGSWMVAPELISAGRFKDIVGLTREAVATAAA